MEKALSIFIFIILFVQVSLCFTCFLIKIEQKTDLCVRLGAMGHFRGHDITVIIWMKVLLLLHPECACAEQNIYL